MFIWVYIGVIKENNPKKQEFLVYHESCITLDTLGI